VLDAEGIVGFTLLPPLDELYAATHGRRGQSAHDPDLLAQAMVDAA
jgi:hypothetical protein